MPAFAISARVIDLPEQVGTDRSDRVARILEVGTRSHAETAHYADIDLLYREVGVPEGYYRRDGSPYR